MLLSKYARHRHHHYNVKMSGDIDLVEFIESKHWPLLPGQETHLRPGADNIQQQSSFRDFNWHQGDRIRFQIWHSSHVWLYSTSLTSHHDHLSLLAGVTWHSCYQAKSGTEKIQMSRTRATASQNQGLSQQARSIGNIFCPKIKETLWFYHTVCCKYCWKKGKKWNKMVNGKLTFTSLKNAAALVCSW